MSTTARTPVRYTQEIRFAVVMYGGVSLAIYMNGIAQELLRMVRATAPDPVRPDLALLSWEDLDGAGRVYRRMGQMLARGEPIPDEAPAVDAPIRTRFVVDVISGTSAGGINGIFLAKALANDQSMDGLRRLWLREGDIARLLNDRASVSDLPPLRLQGGPRSLLNGERMYVELLRAFRSMESSVAGRSPNVDELDLFVTTTDVRGAVVPLRLSDGVAEERRHRDVFRFRYRAGPAATDATGSVNDFAADSNRLLAFAARCTSAFPFAFEPMSAGVAERLVRLFPTRHGVTERPVDAASLAGLLVGAAAPSPPHAARGGSGATAHPRFYGDGGYLDNKPFSYAIDAIARRRATVPVERKLVYVEPDPEHPELVADPEEPPDALDNVRAALLGIPRYETIREDLQRVLARNRLVARVDSVLAGAEADAAHTGRPSRTETLSGEAYAKLDLGYFIGVYGLGYGGYHRLKVAAVSDFLTDIVARVGGLDVGSDEWYAVRYIVRAWRDARYVHYRADDETGGREPFNAFLLRYDLDYRIRRLAYVRTKLDELTAGDAEVARDAGKFGNEAAARATLTDSRRGVDEALWVLTTEREALLAGQPSPLAEGADAAGGTLEGAVAETGVSAEVLRALLDEETEERRREHARRLLAGDRSAAFERVAQRIAERVEVAARRASSVGREALGADPALEGARRTYDDFEAIDLIAYAPLFAADAGGELGRVDVFRIGPEDATGIVADPVAARRKLGGVALYHFGAFLEERWRRNDLLWGRLDGAERLIAAVLPRSRGPLRSELAREAQASILGEELRGPGAESLGPLAARARSSADDARLYEEFRRDYELDRRLDPAASLRSVGRSTTIVGRILDDVADRRARAARPLAVWAIRVGRTFSALVELATPGSFAHVTASHILALLYLSELLLLGGAYVFQPQVRPLAFGLLGATFALHSLIALLQVFIRTPARAALVLGGLGVAALLLLGFVVGRLTSFSVPGLLPFRAWLRGLEPRLPSLHGLPAGVVALGALVLLGLAWLWSKARKRFSARAEATAGTGEVGLGG